MFIRHRFLTLILATPLLLTSACSDDERDPLDIPATYDGASFQTNAATELTVLQQLKTLRDEAFKGRTAGVEVSGETLNTLFTTGSPSLKSLNTTYYASLVEGGDGFLAQLALASGNTYVPGDTDGEGGKYGNYLFDEHGVELEQLIEKGMFGAVLYNHANSLLNGTLSEATPDKVIAIFGAHPDFANSTEAAKHDNPDRYAASYTARRDKNDGNGFYTTMRYNFIKLQAAIRAGDEYRPEQLSAIEAIKENWEKANAATVINYLNAVLSKLSETNPTDAMKSGAMHEISESIGFLLGWRTIPSDDKIITDNQIDALLSLLKAPVNGAASVYAFATDPENELDSISEVIDQLKTIYGFSDAQMEDFKQNWVSVQSR